MKIIPYIKQHGQVTIPDAYFEMLWRLMVEEKTYSKVFAAGGVRDKKQFVECMKSEDKLIMLITDDSNHPLVISWINHIYDGHAFIHFNTFKRTWNKNSIELLKISADYWLSRKKPETGEKILHVLMGAIPENNQLAIKAVKKCGAVEVGKIPNYFTLPNGKRIGVYLCYLETSNG